MYLTGHKNEASVRSYTNKLTQHQSKGMSDVFSESLGYNRLTKSNEVPYKLQVNGSGSGEYEQSNLPTALADSSYVYVLVHATTVHQSSHTSNAASVLFQNCTFSGLNNIQIIDNKWAQIVCVASLFYELRARF